MMLENTPKERLDALFSAQKRYFRSGATLDDPTRCFEDQVVDYITAREKPLV